MKKVMFNDYQKWKKINQDDFSFFDYIFHITREYKLSSDIFFAFLELFWPTFISQDEYIFLKSNTTKEKINKLIRGGKHVEYWANLFIIDSYFENDENPEKRSELFAKSLVEIWRTKLSIDFPDKKFIVEYVYDDDCGDYGLTFYQNKKNE